MGSRLEEPVCICCQMPLVESPIPDIHMCTECQRITAEKVKARIKAAKAAPGVRKTFTIKFK